MASGIVCPECGEQNAPGAQFCKSCKSFLPWYDSSGTLHGVPAPDPNSSSSASDPRSAQQPGRGAAGVNPTDATMVLRPVQRTPSQSAPMQESGRHAAPANDNSSNLLTAEFEAASGQIIPGGATVPVDVRIHNLSPVVDAYTVAAVDGPSWLEVTSAEVRLLPNSAGSARITAQIPPGNRVTAGSVRFTVEVRSIAHPEARRRHSLELTIPAIDAALVMRLEPTVVRAKDTQPGWFQAVVDNSASNQPRQLVMTGSDPDRALRFTFYPPSVEVPPGGSVTVRIRVDGPPTAPGTEASRQISVTGTHDGRTVNASGTFVQIGAPIQVEAPFAIRLEPALVRLRDAPGARLRAVVDNRKGSRMLRVALSGSDPERAVHFSFWPPVVEVGPGQVGFAAVNIGAAPPPPGQEVNRPFTVTGNDGTRDVEATGNLVLYTTPPPEDQPVSVQLRPMIIRGDEGDESVDVAAVVDNSRGVRPRRVFFAGHDPEAIIRFQFSPEYVDLHPGQVGGATVRLTAPKLSGGKELSRPFTVVAIDGQERIEATGTFVQRSNDWRPVWRLLLTLLGGLAMAAGAFLPWHTGAILRIPPGTGSDVSPDITGLEWGLPAIQAASADLGTPIAFLNLADAVDPFVSGGALAVLFGVLVMFGITGTSGRLTRMAALVTAIVMTAFLVTTSFTGTTGRVGLGAMILLVGTALAFVGGLLAKRRPEK